jgi:hypothetical protein
MRLALSLTSGGIMSLFDERLEVIFRIIIVCGVFLYVGETYDLALLRWAGIVGMAILAGIMELVWRINHD